MTPIFLEWFRIQKQLKRYYTTKTKTMTRKHRFYFFLWKLRMAILGIEEGVTVWVYSTNKGKHIRGTITNLTGESITSKDYGFDIQIEFDEPIQGNDQRYFTSGSYNHNKITKSLTIN